MCATKKETLLLFNQFGLHLKKSIKQTFQDCNTELADIPGGFTSKLQYLDVFLKKLLKCTCERMKQRDDGRQCASSGDKVCSKTIYNHTDERVRYDILVERTNYH